MPHGGHQGFVHAAQQEPRVLARHLAAQNFVGSSETDLIGPGAMPLGLVHVQTVHDGHQPDPHIAARAPQMQPVHGAGQALLHQIVGQGLSPSSARIAPQMRYLIDDDLVFFIHTVDGPIKILARRNLGGIQAAGG